MKRKKIGNRLTNLRSKYSYLFALYIIVIMGLFSMVLFHQRGYQDAWILDGVLTPTMVFILFFLVTETFVNDNRYLVLLGVSFLIVLNLIPGLKYELFYGIYDSVGHYGFCKELISLGHVPQIGFYSEYYSDIPGMHILVSSLSLLSGISVNEILRFILPAIYGIIPILIYFVTKGIFNKNIQRYVIIASSFPIVTGYVLTGTTFALILYLLFITLFLRYAFKSEDKAKYSLVLIIIAFSLVISHSVTPFLLLLLLVGMTLILKSLKFMRKKFPRRSLICGYIGISSFFTVLLTTWWAFKADFYLNSLVDVIRRSFIGEIAVKPVPTHFFEIPLLAKLRILSLLHSSDVVIVALSFIGLLVFIEKYKRKELADKTRDFFLNLLLLLGLISAILFFQFAIAFGEIEYQRFIKYAMVLSPFLVGLALWRLDEYLINTFRNTRIKNSVFASVLFILCSTCLIQAFPYQPMTPRVNVLSEDLPKDEYLLEFRMANTIYQKKMISFAEKYSPINTKIASDTVTKWQIYGFTDFSFSSRVLGSLGYSHLSPNETSETVDLEWDLFLLHKSSRAAIFAEEAEYRTEERINKLRAEAGNTIYDNGESFVIARCNSSNTK